MSRTTTRSRRHAAVPQDPTLGPIDTPSIASWYVCGMLGPRLRVSRPSGATAR